MDLALALLWVGVLMAGVGAVVVARAKGLRPSYARDLLHVSAGIWVLGWPYWHGLVAPLAIVVAATVGVALVPAAAQRSRAVAGFRRSVASDDEGFGGLVVYTLAYAVMTTLGLTAESFPSGAFSAAGALWALALGDGLGGLLGRRLGRSSYGVPWGKRKTLEGSMAVAAFAAVGVAAASAWFGAEVGAGRVVALGLVASVVEGLSPRGTDNALVPAAVWGVAELLV